MAAMTKSTDIEPILVHTGQHYDYDMSESFFKELNIPKPDVHMGVGSATHAKQVAMIMEAFDDFCEKENPDLVLVVGDVNSTMACTLVASKRGIKTAHVEAGIRSYDQSMPEEINRMVTDSITDFFFPPSQDAVENLLREGHDKNKIFLVGNIMIDTLMSQQAKIDQSAIHERLNIAPKEYALLTLHRPSNVDEKEHLESILNAMDHIQQKMKIVFPIHPRSTKMLKEFQLYDTLKNMQNVILTEPLGYHDFGRLVKESYFVITDSGGIQEETTVYGIPCITLRENTERPITMTEGTNVLAGSDTDKIVTFAERILAGNWKKGKIPELWDGQTASRIVKIIQGLGL